MTKFIGYSLSRCVVDILENRVRLGQVETIIARTRFDPESEHDRQLIWDGYTVVNGWSDTTWADYVDRREEIESIYLALHRSGRLDQPRRRGQWPQRVSEIWEKIE